VLSGVKLEHRPPVGSILEDRCVRLAKEFGWHGVDDGSALGVVVRVSDFFEELLAYRHQIRISLDEEAKDRECASHIVHGGSATKGRCTLECHRDATSDHIVGMFARGEV